MATRKLVDPKARPKQIHARAGDGKFVGDEPVWDKEPLPSNRKSALLKSFNWYNYNCDNKQAVEFIVQYLDTLPKRKRDRKSTRLNSSH